MPKRYEKTIGNTRRRQLQERNDCAVIATAIAGRLPYKEVHEAYRLEGRRTRCGVYPQHIVGAAARLGLRLELVDNLKQPTGARYTGKTIGKRLKTGYWLVQMRGHIAACVHGEVEDWSADTRKGVLYAYRVVKPRQQRECAEETHYNPED
jgi:hypothetical protein